MIDDNGEYNGWHWTMSGFSDLRNLMIPAIPFTMPCFSLKTNYSFPPRFPHRAVAKRPYLFQSAIPAKYDIRRGICQQFTEIAAICRLASIDVSGFRPLRPDHFPYRFRRLFQLSGIGRPHNEIDPVAAAPEERVTAERYVGILRM